MFTDEAAILQAAATLAAAGDVAQALAASTHQNPVIRQMSRLASDTATGRLIRILREMEAAALIPAGLAPPAAPDQSLENK